MGVPMNSEMPETIVIDMNRLYLSATLTMKYWSVML